MAEESLKNKTVKGAIWGVAERFSVQSVGFIVTLFVARILDPRDFGLIGMLAIFIGVSESIVDSGFTQALIRKQDRTNEDNSTAFFFNFIISLLVYLLLFFIAPYVADFYNEPQLKSLMRGLCLIIVIYSLSIVQRALLSASLDFKTQAKASFTSAIISGIVGIVFALYGFGAWALVFQQVIGALVNTVLLWVYSQWRPLLVFSIKSFKEMFKFGSRLLISGLLDQIYINMYQLVIGKVFAAKTLGFYSQADRFTKLPSSNLSGIVQRVSYPALCEIQNDEVKLQLTFRKLIRLSSFVIFPLMCFLAAIARPLITFLIGEKWEMTAILMIPLCFNLMWYPVHALNLIVLQVKGRSDLLLRLEIIKKIIGVLILAVTLPFGVLVMCYAGIFSSIIGLVINTYYTGKLMKVGLLSQMNELKFILLQSLLLFFFVYLTTMYISHNITALLVAIVEGVILFFIMSVILNPLDLKYMINLVKR